MSPFSNWAMGVVLAAGLVVGSGLAYLNNTEKPVPVAQLDKQRFEVDPANTPGFPQVKGGDFDLIDQTGKSRTSTNPSNQFQLVFFGYAKCKAICSVALPNIAEATDLLSSMGVPVTPVLITVDPKRDTVEALRSAVADIHPKMQGLTGTEEALEKAYSAFNLEKKFLFEHDDHGAVYSHGSFIYLLGPDGTFKTLFAPIISPVRIAEITAGYVAQSQKPKQSES